MFSQIPNCRIYPKKKIGKTQLDFWNKKEICKRFRNGNVSAIEYYEYQADMM
jgi:hypothetical protein